MSRCKTITDWRVSSEALKVKANSDRHYVALELDATIIELDADGAGELAIMLVRWLQERADRL